MLYSGNQLTSGRGLFGADALGGGDAGGGFGSKTGGGMFDDDEEDMFAEKETSKPQASKGAAPK